MTQERIDKITDTVFSNVENRPELLHKIKLDGEDVSVYNLMKSSYIAGLKRNLDEEVSEQVNFSRRPKLESDGSYYAVLHLYSALPELCIYNGKSLLSVVTGNFIESKNMIGAIKLNIPRNALDDLERLREVRKHEVMLNEVVNAMEKSRIDAEIPCPKININTRKKSSS